MSVPARRATYRHGNLFEAARDAAYAQVAEAGMAALSLRQVAASVGVAHRSLYNHFDNREALLDAVAAEGFRRLAAAVAPMPDARRFTDAYLRFALAHPRIYALMNSRPHGSMKDNPPLQTAAHLVITEAMRVFCHDGQDSEARRRTVMKAYIILSGGIAQYAAGILDLPDDEALIAELTAMTQAL